MGSLVHIGVDVGQRVDPTAIVVAELSQRETGETRRAYRYDQDFGQSVAVDVPESEWTYTARRVERLELGTPYPDAAKRVAAIVAGVKERITHGNGRTGGRISLRVDSTGVGRPVVDELAQALKSTSVRPVAVSFTYGDKLVKHRSTEWTLGKAYLVSRLQVLLQNGRVMLPDTAETRTLAEELKDYEIKVSEQGADTYGAFKVGTHDDLVTALGLATLDEPSTGWDSMVIIG